MIGALEAVIAQAPLFQPVMPNTGKPFSVTMTNAGTLGWVSDKAGYRYQTRHPDTGTHWPEIPHMLMDLWVEMADLDAPKPECCLINHYGRPRARMGQHVDGDEQDLSQPVVSLSLGDDALFRIGGLRRKDKTRSIQLKSGDVVVLGGPARRCYHGIDRIKWGTSGLVPGGGRINVTLRRVSAQTPG